MNIDKKEAEKKKSMEKDLTIGLGDMKMTQEEMEQMLENDKEFGDLHGYIDSTGKMKIVSE